MSSDLISVIIPVYNTEKYLGACLDSVVTQSYRNIEVIVINDGSTDSSLLIAESYAKNDDRIHVYSYKNEGQASARNHGLDVATGDYISFVDSDDILLPDALKVLMNLFDNYDADIAEGNFLFGEYLTKHEFKDKKKCCIFNSNEAIENILYQKTLLPSPWGKIYKSYLFDGLRFKKGIIYEDLDLSYKIIDRTKNIVYTNIPVYFYRQVEDSTIHKWEAKRLDVLRVTEDMESYISTKYPTLLPAAKDRRLSANFNMFVLCSINDDRKNAAKCWKYIKENRYRSLFNSKVRLKNKAGILLSYCGKDVFKFVSRRIYK